MNNPLCNAEGIIHVVINGEFSVYLDSLFVIVLYSPFKEGASIIFTANSKRKLIPAHPIIRK